MQEQLLLVFRPQAQRVVLPFEGESCYHGDFRNFGTDERRQQIRHAQEYQLQLVVNFTLSLFTVGKQEKNVIFLIDQIKSSNHFHFSKM